MNLNESLLKTSHSLGFATSDLQAALGKSNKIQALVILPLIEKVVKLNQEVDALREAI